MDASGPYEIKKCGTCNFSSVCEKYNKKKSPQERKDEALKKYCATKKVRITLFGYLFTRNVNLELLHDKSAEQF